MIITCYIMLYHAYNMLYHAVALLKHDLKYNVYIVENVRIVKSLANVYYFVMNDKRKLYMNENINLRTMSHGPLQQLFNQYESP